MATRARTAAVRLPPAPAPRHPPFEVSNAALIDEILHRENSAAMLAVRLEAVSAGAEPVTVAVKPHWTEGRKFPYRYTFSAENYEIVRAANEGRLSKHDTFEDQKRRCMRNIEREISAAGRWPRAM